MPVHLNNTDEYLRRLSEAYPDQKLPSGSIIFSVDVTNLYGNIPTTEAITEATQLLMLHYQDIDMMGLDVPDVTKLLNHCLSNNYLKFGEKYYRQTTGIAMGSRVAPPLAIIFMGALEERYNTTSTTKPAIYMRYVDDVFGVWTDGPASLQAYFNHINGAHPSINFTMENTETSGSIPFLDTKITVEPTGKYTTELYIKPTSSGIILHANSAQPWRTKRAVLESQVTRAIKLSSDEKAKDRSIGLIQNLFTTNGYSKKTINKTVHRVLNRAPRPGRKSTSSARIVLPFIDDKLTSTIQGIVRNTWPDLGIAWSNTNTIRRNLVRSALTPPPCPGGKRCHACAAGIGGKCPTKSVIYELRCTLCQKTYIGETGRRIRLRYNEHLNDAKNQRQDTPWGEHFRQEHSNITPDSKTIAVKILQRANDQRDRKIAESLHIRRLRPDLNTNIASWSII